jgi:3',5'-nucleoside bisphosphate phosphatase
VIDLHLHTTASDGQLSPDALVRTIAAAGVRTFAVTDHDTLAGVAAAATAAHAAGLEAVPGIEITAVHAGRDVHVLGYFVDGTSDELTVFLDRQRADRRRRLVVMLDKLESLGLPVDRAPLEARLSTGQAVGRPLIAAALVAAGHAKDISDAFERFLGEGRVAFEPRVGATPAAVVSLIDRAGGIASLAHPAKLGDAALIADLVAAGLPAIEVYHPDHDAAAVEQFRRLADDHGLLVTGGSDFHGPGTNRAEYLGRVGLPQDDYARLREAARG